MQKFHCESIFVPADYVGLQNTDDSTPKCNSSINDLLIKYAITSYIDRFNACPIKQACFQPRYIMQLVQSPMEAGNVSNVIDVRILLADPLVEYVIDSFSYDIQSLIGEVGGTLGLTLGISAFSITKALEFIARKLQDQMNIAVNFY